MIRFSLDYQWVAIRAVNRLSQHANILMLDPGSSILGNVTRRVILLELHTIRVRCIHERKQVIVTYLNVSLRVESTVSEN